MNKTLLIIALAITILGLIELTYKVIKERRKGETKNIFELIYRSQSNSVWHISIMFIISQIFVILILLENLLK